MNKLTDLYALIEGSKQWQAKNMPFSREYLKELLAPSVIKVRLDQRRVTLKAKGER